MGASPRRHVRREALEKKSLLNVPWAKPNIATLSLMANEIRQVHVTAGMYDYYSPQSILRPASIAITIGCSNQYRCYCLDPSQWAKKTWDLHSTLSKTMTMSFDLVLWLHHTHWNVQSKFDWRLVILDLVGPKCTKPSVETAKPQLWYDIWSRPLKTGKYHTQAASEHWTDQNVQSS